MTEVENVDTKTKMTEMESCDVENTITEIKSSDIKESLADVVSLDGNTTVTEMESTDTKPKATESESSGPKAKVQRCETCNTFCVGEEAFEKHLQSQKHKDKVEGKTTGAGDANKKDSAVNKKDEEKSKSHSRQARKDDSSDSKKKDSQSKSSDKDRDRRVSSRDKGRYGRHDVRRRSAELSRDRSGRRSYHSRSPHHTRDRSRDRKSRTAHSKKKGHSSDNESEGEVMYLSGSDWEIMDETNDDDENQPIEDGKENTKETKSDPTLKSATDKNNEGKTEKETKESFEKVSNHSKTKLDKPETKDKPATKNQSTAKDKSNTTVEKNEKSKNAETEIKNKNTKETTGTENLKDAKDFFCEVCKVHVFNQQNFDKHCTGNKHKTNLMASVNKAAQIAKLQAHVDRCTEPLLGMSLVLEIPRALGEPYYKCLLCDSNCIGKSIISHIKGYKHCVTYLQKFHPAIAAKIPQNKKGGRSGLDAFIQKLGEANRKEKIIVAKESDAVDVARKICESRGLELILNQEGEKQTTVTNSPAEGTQKNNHIIINQPSSMKSRNMVQSVSMNNQRKFPEKTINISSRQNFNSERNVLKSVVPFQDKPVYFKPNTEQSMEHAAAMSKLSQLDAYFGFPGKASPVKMSFNHQSNRSMEQNRFTYNDNEVKLDGKDHFSHKDNIHFQTDRLPKEFGQHRDRSLTPPRDLFRRVSLSPVRVILTNQNRSSRPRDRFSSDDGRSLRDDFGHRLDRSPGRPELDHIERNPRRSSFSSHMDVSFSQGGFIHHINRSPQRDDLICRMDRFSSNENYNYLGAKSLQQDDFDHHRKLSRLDGLGLRTDPSGCEKFDLHRGYSSQRDDIRGLGSSSRQDNFSHHGDKLQDSISYSLSSSNRDNFSHSSHRENFNCNKTSQVEEKLLTDNLSKRHLDRFSNQNEVKKKSLKQGNLNPSLDYFDVNSAKKMFQTADSIVEQPSTNPPSGIMNQNKANYLAAAMLLAQTLLQQRTNSSDKKEIKVEKPMTSTSVAMHNPLASNIPLRSPLEQFNAMSSNFQQQMGFKDLNFRNQQSFASNLKFGDQLLGLGNVVSSFQGSSASMIIDRLNVGDQQMPSLGYYDLGNALHINQKPPVGLLTNPSMNLNANQTKLQSDQSGFQLDQTTRFKLNQGIEISTNKDIGFKSNQAFGFNPSTRVNRSQYTNQGFGFNFNNAMGFNSSQLTEFHNNQPSGKNKQLNLFEQKSGFGTSQPYSSFGTPNVSNSSLLNLNPVRGFQFSNRERPSIFETSYQRNFNKFNRKSHTLL